MSQDDFQFGDNLDFSETSQPQHGAGSFVVLCCVCGDMRAFCGLCLMEGIEPCPCGNVNNFKFLV